MVKSNGVPWPKPMFPRLDPGPSGRASPRPRPTFARHKPVFTWPNASFPRPHLLSQGPNLTCQGTTPWSQGMNLHSKLVWGSWLGLLFGKVGWVGRLHWGTWLGLLYGVVYELCHARGGHFVLGIHWAGACLVCLRTSEAHECHSLDPTWHRIGWPLWPIHPQTVHEPHTCEVCIGRSIRVNVCRVQYFILFICKRGLPTTRNFIRN